MLINRPFHNLGAIPDWHTVYDVATDSSGSGYADYNTRLVLNAGGYAAALASGSKVRVTLSAVGAAGQMRTIGTYVGHPASGGDAYDMDGNQVQCLFSGNGGVYVNAGNTQLSDETDFDFDPNKDLIVSVGHENTTSYVGRKAGVSTSVAVEYDGYPAGSQVGDSDVTGYGQTISGRVHGISKVEIYGVLAP